MKYEQVEKNLRLAKGLLGTALKLNDNLQPILKDEFQLGEPGTESYKNRHRAIAKQTELINQLDTTGNAIADLVQPLYSEGGKSTEDQI